MTHKSEEMLRLERDMDEQLKEKLDAEIKRISGEAQSDGEAMVKAAAALGYTITIEELERSVADLEQLDDDELDASGGNTDHFSDKFTINEEAKKERRRQCGHAEKASYSKDENGHKGSCTFSWHCSITWKHTESNSKDVMCLTNYACHVVVHD